MSSDKIRVLIVDDHPIVRQGVAALLASQRDIELVGEAATGAEAIEMHRELAPHVTLMDLRLPDMSGSTAIERIRGEAPQARFVVLTTYDGDEDIHRALAAGARGYMLKDMFVNEIVGTIRDVHAGLRRIPEAIAQRLDQRPVGAELSPREMDVLRLMAAGETNKGIAQALGITEGTVKWHVVAILGKLGVAHRTAAVTVAMQRGLLRG